VITAGTSATTACGANIPTTSKPPASPSSIETCDIYPTLAELAKLPAPKQSDGRSFAQVLANPSASTRDHIIHVFPRQQGLIGRAVRTTRHRLVEWKKPGAPADTAILELYDYQTDPAETKNLAAEQPEVITTLRQLLATHPEAKPQIPNKPKK